MFILGLCACHKFGAVFQTVTVIYWHDYASSQKWDCKHAEQTEVHVSFFLKKYHLSGNSSVVRVHKHGLLLTTGAMKELTEEHLLQGEFQLVVCSS